LSSNKLFDGLSEWFNKPLSLGHLLLNKEEQQKGLSEIRMKGRGKACGARKEQNEKGFWRFDSVKQNQRWQWGLQYEDVEICREYRKTDEIGKLQNMTESLGEEQLRERKM